MRRLPVPLLLAVVAAPQTASAATLLWATPSSTAQKLTAAPRRSPAYDGESLRLAACRNETEGLVLRVTDGGGPLNLSALENEAGDVLLSSALEVFELVHAADGCLDAIVPRRGVALTPQNAALLRVHVPADAAPGPYRGTVQVGDASRPLELTVWPQTLPDEPTFFRNAPHWSSGTPKRDLGFEAAKAEFDALWRARLTPAHAFWGKRPWWHFERSMDVDPAADWPDTDAFYGYYFRRGGKQIDIDWYYAYPHDIRLLHGTDDPKNAIRYLRTVRSHLQQTFAAAERIFVQNRADEPTLGQGREGRQHCEYQKAIAWAKVIRTAAPDLKILLAEHPAPQLLRWTDIFNSPWTHARGPDARALEELGKRLLWYSADIKSPADLHVMRATYWRAFATDLHGAWTWERYRYLPRHGGSYRHGCIYKPGTTGDLPPEVPVASMKLEAAGEGHDDFEALRLLERWAGDPFAALSFAQHSLCRSGPCTAPQATDLGPNDFAPLRRTLAFLLQRTHVKTWTFKAADGLSRSENVERVTGDTGFARLEPARVARATGGEAFGRATATVEPGGGVRVEMTGGRRMCGADFALPKIYPAREVRFDIRVQPNKGVRDGLANMGLFDIYLRINGRYGTGVNWKTGEYNRTCGHWSDGGSFPGQWRSVRCVLAHTINAPRAAESVGIAIGRMGHFDTNDPLPGQRYTVRVRGVRATSRAHKSPGVIETAPVDLPEGEAWAWWVTDHRPPAGTAVRLEARRGEGDWQPLEPLPDLVGVAKLPPGPGPVALRITLTGGPDSPYLHALGLVSP
jgi:hypothetical protein